MIVISANDIYNAVSLTPDSLNVDYLTWIIAGEANKYIFMYYDVCHTWNTRTCTKKPKSGSHNNVTSRRGRDAWQR